MAGLDPGEFARGTAAREELRTDLERQALEELLAAGWGEGTAAEARRLHDEMAAAVAWALGRRGSACNETALGLVGEARGRAFAAWWAAAHGVDERLRAALMDCAAAVAALTLIDGFHLGLARAAGELVPLTAALRPAPARDAHLDRARSNGRPLMATVP
ncbi:MAG: hypothetical protein C4290_05205 [Chloroflexota bacterium]